MKSFNNYLEEVRTELGQCYRELQIKKQSITVDRIKNLFLRTEDEEYTINRLFEYHNSSSKNILAFNTLSHYKTSQNYILMFVKCQFKKKDLHLYELNYKFLVDFENFLRNYKPKDREP